MKIEGRIIAEYAQSHGTIENRGRVSKHFIFTKQENGNVSIFTCMKCQGYEAEEVKKIWKELDCDQAREHARHWIKQGYSLVRK